MNVFAVDPSPMLCARALDDKRLRKMLLETAQLMCTALNEMAGMKISPYNSTHPNHPLSIWARDPAGRNLHWLLLLGEAYTEECIQRFAKFYEASKVIGWMRLWYDTNRACYNQDPTSYPINWYNAASHSGKDISFKHIADTHLAYRLYLNARWRTDVRAPQWTMRGPPSWYQPAE